MLSFFLSLAAAFGHSLFFLHLGFLFIFSTLFLSLSLSRLAVDFSTLLSCQPLSHPLPYPLLPLADHNPTSLSTDALVFEIVYLASAHPPSQTVFRNGARWLSSLFHFGHYWIDPRACGIAVLLPVTRRPPVVVPFFRTRTFLCLPFSSSLSSGTVDTQSRHKTVDQSAFFLDPPYSVALDFLSLLAY